jgi:hypothetical protein
MPAIAAAMAARRDQFVACMDALPLSFFALSARIKVLGPWCVKASWACPVHNLFCGKGLFGAAGERLFRQDRQRLAVRHTGLHGDQHDPSGGGSAAWLTRFRQCGGLRDATDAGDGVAAVSVFDLTGTPWPADDRPRSTYLLALVIRKFLKRFPGQLTHAGLQVRDGDPFGIFEIV